MTLRLLHTADWQLGKPFHNVPGDAGARLREARFAAIRRIAALAGERKVDAVLVAGDIFDSNQVVDGTIHKTVQALCDFAGTWVLLPGNHDAHLAECVWTRLERLGCPAHLIVAKEPAPIPLADGRLVVLPAPLIARRTLDDLTAWMDTAETPAAAVRVGLAHGAVQGRLPAAADADNPIAPDRAERARLDYLALGDWHGTTEIAPRTWYAGTPEPDRFPQNDPGNVLVVELDGPGLPPRVERVRTASHSWRTLELTLADDADAAATVESALAAVTDVPHTLVCLTLAGTIGLAGRAAVDAVLDRWRPRFCHLDIDDGRLVALPAREDLVLLDDGGVVGAAARRLGARVEAGDAEAELALRLLWAQLRGMPAP